MQIYNKNCLEGLKDLSANSVDFVFCDLPYNCTKCKWDKDVLDLDELSKQLWRVAKPECPIIFTAKFKFAINIVNAFGIKNFRYDMVFCKNRATNFLNAKKMPKFSHENVLVFYKKLPKIYNKNILKYHKITYRSKNKNVNKYKNQYLGNIGKKINNTIYEPLLPDTLLKYSIHNVGNSNSTQKPLELLEWFLKYYTDESFTVLDPTMGSGTTGVACKNMKRKFIGFELDEEQFNKAKERIEKTPEPN
jgi:site-specific DNA-methyltransferase (adenine-specific)